jgi:hypothetical protein
LAEFKFYASSATNQLPLNVEIFIEDRSIGLTPRCEGEFLIYQSKDDSTPRVWFAMYLNSRIAKGESVGGTFHLVVNERVGEVCIKIL